MKVGNTSFNPEAIKAMKFADFKKTYGGLLTGATLEEAYKKCGGKLKQAPPPPQDHEESDD